MERGKKYYDWNCWKCKKRNFQNRASCIECGAPDKRPADWNCPNCQSVVFGSKDHCFKCGTKSPNGKPVPEKRPNDWNCPNCQFLVWGSKNQCSKCGAASPNGSQTRPGDWTCGCSASNFAKRSHCYVCGKEKSVSQQECPICFEQGNPFSLLVPCGHQCCLNCAPLLTTCYQCRLHIKERIRVYEL